MANKEDNYKIVLLLQPQRLLHRHPVVQLLSVGRTGTLVNMEELPITTATVSQYMKYLGTDARKVLLNFSQVSIEKEKAAIEWRFTKQRGFKDEKDYLNHHMSRYYQRMLGFLKQFSGEISWYHRLPAADNKNLRTAPCTYHPISVHVEFVCTLQAGGPHLQVNIKTTKGLRPLEQFRRFYFLLEQNNEYWHLSLTAYEALEWLYEQDLKKYANDVAGFLHHLALPLKQKGHTVHMDELVQKEQLEVVPAKRVLLSELNNSFLMLTPQYVYDGHMIEGPYESIFEKEISGKALVIKRNQPIESEFNLFLKQLHPNFSRQINGYFYLTFADAQKKQWFLKVYHQLLELDVELLGMDMLKHFRYSPHKATTEVIILAQNEQSIHLEMTLKFGKETVPLNELQKMLLNGQKAVLLKDGSLGVLGDDWISQYATALKHSKVTNKKELHTPRWMAMSEEDGTGGMQLKKTIAPDWWNKWKKWQQTDEALYPVPATVQVAILRPYQQKGFDWINILAEAGGSACLADDMGLGKTLQTICFMAGQLHKNPAGKQLVVCPASLIYNWQQEFEKFAPTLTTLAYHGNNRQSGWMNEADNKYQVIITSYGTLRVDVDKLSQIFFDVVVIDESHHIKNPTAHTTRAVNELQSRTRIALSGTPVMNGTNDLFSQLNFLLPGLLGNREFFRREYATPIEQQGNADKAQELQKLIAPFVLRRTKEQVAPDLPPKTETILWCEMGSDQKMAYESIKENIRSSVLLEIEQNGLNKGKLSVLAGLTKLRQICNSCELVTNEDLFTYDSIKTDLLIEELKNIISAHKALVFSQFTSMLDLLERDFTKAGIRYQRLDGSTKIIDRQNLVNEFQEVESEAKVFLLSLKAGNTGLTLTAADYVFLFDPWWNVAVENQAIDRTHRIGQNQHVFAYRMICKDTVEEKIMSIQKRKQKLGNDLITTDEGFMQGLTIEDVKYLLE